MEDEGAGLTGRAASTWNSCKKEGVLVGLVLRRGNGVTGITGGDEVMGVGWVEVTSRVGLSGFVSWTVRGGLSDGMACGFGGSDGCGLLSSGMWAV